MNNETLEFIQEQLEYEFDEPKLLRQAFTRKSYSEEHNGAYHNEVLEFYGDKALEFIVMKKLSEYFGETTQNGKYASQKTEGQLTEIKKKLVCRKMLAHRIDVLDFADCLLMGKGDEAQNAQDQESVKEDLFEAIIGAVAIDCGWNVVVLEEVVDRMLDVEYYLENGLDDSTNYVDLIQAWSQKKYGDTPQYIFHEYSDGYECIINFSYEYNGFMGSGYSKREARMSAAENAYRFLEEENELLDPFDEVGAPSFDRAINQLQELYQKGYIDEITYNFSEDYDRNGNPIWKCVCMVENRENYWEIKSQSKKAGKKMVAYKMLCDILGWEEDDEA